MSTESRGRIETDWPGYLPDPVDRDRESGA